jgi:hypothetical protein
MTERRTRGFQMGRQHLTSAAFSSINPFQFSLIDLTLLIALHAVALSGTIQIFRSLPTSSFPRKNDGFAIPPHLQHEEPVQYVVLEGINRFTPRWLRRFVVSILTGSVAILLSFFVAARAVKGAGDFVRLAFPRFAASLGCLAFVFYYSFWAYSYAPYSYTLIEGKWIHKTLAAGTRALIPAIIVICIVASIEIWRFVHPQGTRIRRVTGRMGM